MGNITKTAGERHEATLSPFAKEFIQKASSIPTRELRAHLASFPSLWPFPRGDLYHWIPALNRFDELLAEFIKLYELEKGPQSRPFGDLLVSKDGGDQDTKGKVPANGTASRQTDEDDVELVKTILQFTALLLSNCGNRSLYASSERLNNLLQSSDLSLVVSTLQLGLLLAKRYYSSKQRMTAVGGSVHLSAHYQIEVDRIRKMAAPFAVPSPTPRSTETPIASAKGKDKKLHRSSKANLAAAAEPKLNGSDFVSIVKNDSSSSWKQWADISMSFYPDKTGEQADLAADDGPESPSVRRTTTAPGAGTSGSSSDRNVIVHRRRSLGDESSTSNQHKSTTFEIGSDLIASRSVEDAVRSVKQQNAVPESSQFELLHKIRTAKALISSREDRLKAIAIRLLAIANLAFVESQQNFYAEFSRADSEQPRQLQVAYQVAELVQPPANGDSSQVPLDLQITALTLMEALTHHRGSDVYAALNANVNHGILFYMVRKAVDQLREGSDSSRADEEWREALFGLLQSLPTVMPRAGDMMMSAGLLDILLEVLQLRTPQAERTHYKALTFLDSFVYSVRDGYQTFANAKGLDIAKFLTAHIVTTSFEAAQSGNGMPQEYKSPIVDYQIPFFLQLTLRWVLKFVNHLMQHNNANFGRQMRNLIDSPEMLQSFRDIMSHADVFGSNVWAGAVTIWTTFIHNEPTSYSVIAESKLGECFLESLTQPAKVGPLKDSGIEFSLLPVNEAISVVPQAFQALCLNEQGMKLVTDSGALDKFFKIFTSPLHIKALETDRDLAQSLGSAFDELCRHQPTLRKAISAAVCEMVSQVAQVCKERASKQWFGSKLWVSGEDGKLYAAGGRRALAGQSASSTEATAMETDGDDNVSMDEVSTIRKDMPYPTAYLGAASRFLIGYLQNTTMCAQFIEAGGVEQALDLVTSPCLPPSFDATNCGFLMDDIARMLSMLSDSKVYIVLPTLVKRLQAALNQLPSFLDNQGNTAYFAPYTSESINKNQLDNPSLAEGTLHVKALVSVNILCNALCYICSNSNMYAHRPSNSVLTQVNITDMWTDVIDKLGKLSRSCTWEEVLLTTTIPDKWAKTTRMPHSPEDEETERILRYSENSADITSLENLFRQTISNAQKADDERPEPLTAQFENIRILRDLFHRTPTEISHFFSALGRILLSRRPSNMQRQNATLIADQLARSALETLNFKTMDSAGVETEHVHRYWIVVLGKVSRLIIDDSYERTGAQTLTLILKSFKEQDGFDTLEKILESFVAESKSLSISDADPEQGIRSLADTMAGIKTILHFYSRATNAKILSDSAQTAAMASRSSDSGADFSVGNFLVEMRYAVIKPVLRLWEDEDSSFMNRAITPVVQNLIQILKIQLECENEGKAITRADKAPTKREREPKKWSPANPADLDRLAADYGEKNGKEALYRCCDNMHNATEYCKYAKKFGADGALVSLPENQIATPKRSTSAASGPSTSRPPAEEQSGRDTSMSIDEDDSTPAPQLPESILGAPDDIRDFIAAAGAGDVLGRARAAQAVDPSREPSRSPAQDKPRLLAGKVPGLVTVDDLNEEREKLRGTLIERSLDVLSIHQDVSFELAELISASVLRSGGGKEYRANMANMLLMALISLEPEDSKRVASTSHLLALVLARDDFYNLIESELVENFSSLVSLVQPPPADKQKEGVEPNAVAHVLLVLERILSSDAIPQQIEYKFPAPDAENVEKNALVELKPPLISLEDKQELFEAVMKLLLTVGKDESLALSVLRILVILTRKREIATQLGEKPNIRKLFLMVRQLHGMSDEKAQSSFLIILRHIIEDEETLRNIMANEIVASWSNRSHGGRGFDTTNYVRQYSQMAIRNPDIFVKATNDKVMIDRYSGRQGPQTLKLKEDPAAPKASRPKDETATEGESSKQAAGAAPEKKEEKPPLERTKTADLKMPVVENPDGVIHFILGELLNYKTVEDTPASTEKDKKAERATPSASTDVEMGDASSSASTPAPETAAKETKKSEKPVFKAEDHPVYIYRCFLLQCLTELLSCYNRTKVEFINFTRKAEQDKTPSKPRSQVLNYLLHDLIPTGSLSHPDDFQSKKRDKTSTWAMSVVVALCSKTGEVGFSRPVDMDFTDYKEEPELMFVRRFVLEHAIKAYREAQTSDSEGLEQRYSRLLCLADLFNRMLTGKPSGGPTPSTTEMEMLVISQRMLAKTMYEKGYISAMTSSVAEIDLNFPNAKRAVKYILKPLKWLTQCVTNDLSLQSEVPVGPGGADDDEIASDSEVSSIDDQREQTPDLYRNSALGIMEPNMGDSSESDSEDDDDEDEEMYGDYGEEMEFDEEIEHDHDDVVSDEEQEIAEMGPIEGLPGDVAVDMEIVGMDEDEEGSSDDDDDSDDDEDSDEDDDELDEDDLDEMEEILTMEEDVGADDESWEDQPEGEEDLEDGDELEIGGAFPPHPPEMPAGLAEIMQAFEEEGGDDLRRQFEEQLDEDMPEEDFIDGEMHDGDEDEEDPYGDEYDEEEIAFEPEMDDDEEIDMRHQDAMDIMMHEHRHRHGHGHLPPGHGRGPWHTFPPNYRSHRPANASRPDDGTNPLLQRPSGSTSRQNQGHDAIGLPGGLGRLEIPANGSPAHFLNSLISAMSAGNILPNAVHARGGALHVTINNAGGMGIGGVSGALESLMRQTRGPGMRGGRNPYEPTPSRPNRDDPSAAVVFTPSLTMQRWSEESRILFGPTALDRANRVINSIFRLLVPPAIEEAKRKAQEEEEARKKVLEMQEKARKEKEEQERKEKEEREAKEKKEREERKAAEAEAAARAAEAGEEQMEGVESTAEGADDAAAAPEAGGSEPAQRFTTTIDGREIDITNLGIDPEYLAALPEEMRSEVIMDQTLQQRQTQAETGGDQPELDPEFLEALPSEMRDELMQQLHLDQRRRDREAARRRNAAAGQPPRPDDMDTATFFATLDPTLRSQLLMEVDEESLGSLPPNLQAEARQLSGHHRRLDHYVDVNMTRRDYGRDRSGDDGVTKRKPTQYAQLLDKAGVATLLRLMFVPQSSSIRNNLNGVLRDVCHNKQNRAEVVSILLSILQDGSNDISAVERSFSLLSIRAKMQASSVQKTPQPKRTTANEPGNGIGEISPVTVVQQCLLCLDFLVQHNPRIAEFFLTEHETGTGFKPRSTRKGKGKETKSSKYPINALLGLLDRKIIIESAPVMELLASLLQRMTHPLNVLLRKEKEKDKEAEEKKDDAAAAESAEVATAGEGQQGGSGDVEMVSPDRANAPVVPVAPEAPEPPTAEGSADKKDEDKSAEAEDKPKPKRTLSPPEVPEYNLRLIINIIAARECPSKTFKDTLSLITNLSAIPEAKEIFGQELIRQAQDLGKNILTDLDELDGQISEATSGADVQGMALAKFSPPSSDQAKLLRVITALDFLFDPKKADTQDKPSTSNAQSLGSQQKEDILTTLYENRIFVSLWDRLGQTLTMIHKRENMFSVANILLPLIEVLMVVCKNSTLKDTSSKSNTQDFSVSSPEPESREAKMENVFFQFTEDHRKILNELVRHNPKLMSGSFKVLVKNSKVLEFDNKRNYFNRQLHTRGSELRTPHGSLQLSVRRDQVFLDSFKHLYYKKPDEFKYGKLSIRFAGEEGVDAGGVTREWFQALTKQMFDPNYALFVPVAADRTTFHPNPESAINEQHLTFFKFIGRIIGKALYENRVLDCHFSRAVYKRILGRSISIKDMESLDNDYAKNLQWMLDNEISGILAESFSVSREVFGEEKVVDLIPGGRDVEVDDSNKQDYVQKVVEYKLIGSVKEQMEHFLQGFHDIVPADLISIFNEQELELLISGLPDIDVEDWRNNTEYHNYTSSSPQIQWFWRAVRSFDKEERAKLLQFVTGTSKVPLNGFKELEGMNGFSRFNIHRDYGNKERLPSSHTCFNQLDLPEYESYEDLRRTLYTAITAGSEYFGFA